ncbi:MAG: relaxase [Pseudomonadota bacterium]
MILVGNARGSSRELAAHLMNARDNEHIELHEVRGFVAEDVRGAFDEARAMANGTRCQKYLFSLSFNPPGDARADIAAFEKAIDEAEERLGLTGQPRVIIFHEKDGRRHAHAVWSRIDPVFMRAVELPFFKRKLNALARELFLEHGWELPKGLLNPAERDPRNFSLGEWQQAKRIGKDPRVIKADFQAAWTHSDSPAALKAALEERGYFLARGDRRDFVAVDWQGEVYALARWAGVKTKEVRDRLGNPQDLPAIEDVKTKIGQELTPVFKRWGRELGTDIRKTKSDFEAARAALIDKQQRERSALAEQQAARRTKETLARQTRFRSGVSGLWDRLTGRHGRIARRNEQDAEACRQRDRQEHDDMIAAHLHARRSIKIARQRGRNHLREQVRDLKAEWRLLKSAPARSARESDPNRARRRKPAPPGRDR